MNELTREQILAMPAGRELDALVAENVFGYKMADHYRTVWCKTHYDELKRYSRDLYAAWELVWEVDKEINLYREKIGSEYVVSFGYSAEECSECGVEEFMCEFQTKSTNICEAICKASLLAVMGL